MKLETNRCKINQRKRIALFSENLLQGKKTNSQIIFLINEISFQLRMQMILKLMICEDHLL